MLETLEQLYALTQMDLMAQVREARAQGLLPKPYAEDAAPGSRPQAGHMGQADVH